MFPRTSEGGRRPAGREPQDHSEVRQSPGRAAPMNRRHHDPQDHSGAGPRREPWLVDFFPLNPFRPPDWRWRLGQYIVTQVTAPRRPWFDKAVYRVVHYLRAPGKRRTARSRVDADLERAILIHDDADPHARVELEARLMSGQDEAAIAGRLGLTPEMVDAYAATFFEVRGRQEHIDYIATNVLGSDFYRLGPRLADTRTLTLWFGWNFGPLGLELLLYRLGWPGSSSWGDPPDPDLIRSLDVLLAVHTRRCDETTALKEIRLCRQLAEIEAGPDPPDAKAVRRAVRRARGLYPDPEFFVEQFIARRACAARGEDEGKDENLSAFLRGVDQFLARAARLPAEDQASPDGVLGSFPRPEPGGDRTGDPGEATGPDLPAP